MVMVRMWQRLSGPAKLISILAVMLVIEFGLFAIPPTFAMGGLIDPFHPWAIWFFLGIFMLLFLFIAVLAWVVHTLNGRNSANILRISTRDNFGGFR
jgi:hypothetical protein